MNWDSIKYIFQIPLSWYQKIHKRVFNAYGTNFLTVREGYYGGTEVGIDSDGFAAEVNRAVDLSGYVKYVDGQEPDETGNVQLSGYVKTIDGEEPDADGNIELSDYYVTLSTDQTIVGEKTFEQPIWLSDYAAISAEEDKLHIKTGTNGITLSSSLDADMQLLDNEPNRLYSSGADNQIATRGYCRLNFSKTDHTHGNLENDGTITAVAGATPIDYYIAADANGNLYRNDLCAVIPDVSEFVTEGQLANELTTLYNDLTVYVQTELTDYVTTDQITSFVTEDELTNYVQQSELTDYVQHSELTDYVTQNEITDFVTDNDVTSYVQNELTAYVKSVQGNTPDINGDVNFGLAANKWMKTDSSGHLSTTNEVPISLSSTNHGYLYANNGSLQFKDEEYVTLSTNQTITGKKFFENTQYFQRENNSDGMTTINGESINIVRNNAGSVPSITMLHSTGNGCNISRGSQGLQLQDTYVVGLNAPTAILLSSAANGVVLGTQPTDTTTTSKAVATVGYCQTNFGKVKTVNGTSPDANGNVTISTGSGTVKSVDHISPDQQGNVQINAIRTINGHNGDSVGNFAGVVTSVNSTAPDANGNVDVGTVKSVNSTTPDASGNVDIDVVTSVDGHQPDSNGAVSFGLTASKWVKTDSSGHLTTTNESVASFSSTPVTNRVVLTDGTSGGLKTLSTTGNTATVTVVTSVTWSGTQIVIKSRTLTYQYGILTSTGTESTSYINTIAYSS